MYHLVRFKRWPNGNTSHLLQQRFFSFLLVVAIRCSDFLFTLPSLIEQSDHSEGKESKNSL